MNEAGRKRWWRAAAVAVLGGGVVVSGWAGLSHSAAHPSVEHPSAEHPIDAPANAPSPPAAPGGEVIPAVATEPAPPTLPALPSLPNPPESKPAALPALPAIPPIDAAPSAPPLLPPLPSVPTTPAPTPPVEAVKQPDAPKPQEPAKPVEAKPVELPKLPDVPKPADAAKPTEQVKPIEPAKPIESVKPTEPVKPEVPSIPPLQPVLPPPSITPSLPPSSELAPSPSPAKSPESAQPNVPPPPVSGLQGGNTGNTVKTENPGGVPATPTARPVIPAPEPVKPIEVPPHNPEKLDFPVPGTAATPGDTTVTNVNKTVAAAVLSGALFSLATPTPATAQDNKSGTNQPDPIATQLADIKKDLKTLNEVLLGRKDKEGYPIESSPGLVAELNKLSDRLAAVETELKKMKAQQQSSSLRPNTLTPGTTSPAPAVIAAKGIVRVVNEYPVQISIVVNGTSYRVAPTRTLDVEVPAGEFSYQLLESGGATTKSTIKDKETVTLRIK